MKVQKGQYGFLGKQKKQFIVKIILFIAVGIAMFGVGLLANKGDPKNICSVLAILMVMPMAKAFTELIVVFPYQDVALERFEKAKSVCPKEAELMTGLVITSEKKVMNLDFLVECNGNVIGLAGKKEEDLSYLGDYLSKGVRNWGYDYQVKVLGEERAFLNAIQSIKPHEVTETEKKNVLSYLKSLIVQ